MISLTPPKGRSLSSKVAGEIRKKKTTKKRGFPTAFTPGLLKSNSNNISARGIIYQIYLAALESCGFSKGRIGLRKPLTWKVY